MGPAFVLVINAKDPEPIEVKFNEMVWCPRLEPRPLRTRGFIRQVAADGRLMTRHGGLV